MNEVKYILGRGVDASNTKYKEVEDRRPKIQRILRTLTVPSSPFDEISDVESGIPTTTPNHSGDIAESGTSSAL